MPTVLCVYVDSEYSCLSHLGRIPAPFILHVIFSFDQRASTLLTQSKEAFSLSFIYIITREEKLTTPGRAGVGSVHIFCQESCSADIILVLAT